MFRRPKMLLKINDAFRTMLVLKACKDHSANTFQIIIRIRISAVYIMYVYMKRHT